MNAIKTVPIDLFYMLPDEMLSNIASFLIHNNQARCAFSRVCRRFCGVAHDKFDQSQTFQHACRRGYIDIVQLLLEDGRVDPAANDN